MPSKSHGRAAVCLCLLTLGVIIASAQVAHAETGAAWMVKGANVTSTLLPKLKGEIGHNFTLWEAFGKHFEFLCETGLWLSGGLNIPSIVGVSIDLIKCHLLVSKKEIVACKPHTNGQPVGTIRMGPMRGLLVLHEGKGLIEFLPETGTVFANVEVGEECSAGEVIPIGGKFTLKDSEGKLGTEQVTHRFQEGPLTQLWALSSEHPATMGGTHVVTLAGEHAGMTWSGLPA